MFRAKFVTLALVAAPFFLRAAVALESPKNIQAGSDRSDYVGDASCLKCHREVGQLYELTPHHLTSQLPTTKSVLGSFQSGANSLVIVDATQSAGPGLQFHMESKKDGLFEVAKSGWGRDVYQWAERIDLVTGSGARGQTYLYWQRDRLYELPVSYWSDGHRWINSPGYVDGTAEFSRPVNPACLECHATYIRALSADPATNRYDRTSLVPGISCESCHGPGANHVRQELRHESKGNDSLILNPAKFSRDLQVDLCAECHNGIQREPLKPAFSYRPGQPLHEYFKALPVTDAEHPDVHGNQVGLLQRSKCYQSSNKMSCSTCHDVHSTGQPIESYSLKCLSCHQWQSCGMSRKMGRAITNKCIECHMPVEETHVIVSQTAGQVVRAKLRNHWIKVYPDFGPSRIAEQAHRP